MRKCLQDFVVQGVRENGDIPQLVRTHSLETPWATKDCGEFPWETAVFRIISPLLPGPSRRVDRPSPDLRKMLNTILYIEITGCRWCDVPFDEQWAKRSTTHEWFGDLQKSET